MHRAHVDVCRPMLGLLFARLPPRAKVHAVKRVAKFVTGSSLPSMGKEVGLLARAAAEVCSCPCFCHF